MSTSLKIVNIRTRKLGLLMYDARIAAGKSQEACAEAMQIPLEDYQAFETGQSAPSLPQLEAFSYFLNVPLQHFWGTTPLSQRTSADTLTGLEARYTSRNLEISAALQAARAKTGLSLSDLALKTDLDEQTLFQYEEGIEGIPVPQLDLITEALGIPTEALFDQTGEVGRWRTERDAVGCFLQLPMELQWFIADPENQPYLEFARRIQGMDLDRLQALARALLDLTGAQERESHEH
jgi:transcriptional regulator with XRE-family HTH domain